MQESSRHNRRTIKIAAAIAAFLVIGLVVLGVVSLTYGDKAKQLVVAEINKHLLVPAEVGEVEFTLFRNFPDASVVFRQVAIKPPAGAGEAPGLLHAKGISLRFGIFSLFTGEYRIRSVDIQEASVTLWRDKDGRNNFEVWKKGGSEEGKKVDFDIQRVVLRKSKVYYRDVAAGNDLAVAISYVTLKGKISGAVVEAGLSGNLAAERLLIGPDDYSLKESINLHADVILDQDAGTINITRAGLRAGGEDFSVSGLLSYGKRVNATDLLISVEQADIEKLFILIPERFTASLKDYRPGGRLTAELRVKGNYGGKQSPLVTAGFSVKKGSLAHLRHKTRLSGIVASGSYTAKTGNRADRLEFTEFEGSAGRGNFRGKLLLENSVRPKVNLTLSASLFLDEIAAFMPEGQITDARGKLVADISYEGSFDAAARVPEKASGLVSLADAGFVLVKDGRKLSDLNAELELRNGSVMIDRLSLKTGRSDLSLSGNFRNLAAFLFQKDQPLFFDAAVRSERLCLEDIAPASAAATAGEGQPGNAATAIFPERVGFNAAISCDLFTYRDFSAEKVSGRLSLDDRVLRVGSFSMKAMDGSVSGSGVLNNRYGSHAQVVCNVSLHDVDIQRLFREFGDFGQTSLQSRHLKGRADAEVQYGATMSNRFETDAASVSAIADLEIRDGELVGFEPLQELSRFLDADELMNVKFSTLKNRVEIARKTVIIPEMEVKSSVMGLKGYGSHTFGNDIDYHLNLLLSEIGRNKKRRNPAPAGASEIAEGANTRLFLHLTGTVDQPVFRYDSQAVVKKMADDFKNQKQELRQALRSEFGKDRNAPPPKDKKASEVKFEIEWDED